MLLAGCCWCWWCCQFLGPVCWLPVSWGYVVVVTEGASCEEERTGVQCTSRGGPRYPCMYMYMWPVTWVPRPAGCGVWRGHCNAHSHYVGEYRRCMWRWRCMWQQDPYHSGRTLAIQHCFWHDAGPFGCCVVHVISSFLCVGDHAVGSWPAARVNGSGGREDY